MSPPALLSPANGAAVQGVANFRWLPTGPLEPGVKYEVVWWNVNESPDAARGIAPPSTRTALSADLAPLQNSFAGGQFYWTVLLVTENPYVRLSSPGESEQSLAFYGR